MSKVQAQLSRMQQINPVKKPKQDISSKDVHVHTHEIHSCLHLSAREDGRFVCAKVVLQLQNQGFWIQHFSYADRKMNFHRTLVQALSRMLPHAATLSKTRNLSNSCATLNPKL